MVKCRRMKRQRCMSKNWIYSWLWKSSRIRQQSYRSESIGTKTDILTSGSTVNNHISKKNGIRIQCNTENFVSIVVPGLSASSSSSSHPSTSMTPSTQENHCSTSSSSSSTSPTTTVLSDSDSRKGRPVWDRFPSSICVKFSCWTNRKGRPVKWYLSSACVKFQCWWSKGETRCLPWIQSQARSPSQPKNFFLKIK